MRFFVTLIFLITFCACQKDNFPGNGGVDSIPSSDSFNVVVNNGYGSGRYKAGDTVHVFSVAYNTTQLFDKWSGDIVGLEAPAEWHTFFVMPAKNITVTGTLKTVNTVSLNFEMIRGRDRMKPVYSYFALNQKGLVYLLHGTGGTAQNITTNYEWQQLIKTLENDGYSIIVTEAEEATTGVDANADGKLRWLTYPIDTINNIDYANIRILTDSFYNRGSINRSLPRYSIGMSNGGAYSAALSFTYHFKAGISYCAPVGAAIASLSPVPFQFCMAKFDNNENVGPQGNADALSNSSILTGRGICSKYFIKQHAPIYPERFARSGMISIATSQAILAELKTNGYINSRNYFIGYSTEFITFYQANPAKFPQLSSLNLLQQLFVLDQIDLSVSDHKMYSDYDQAILKFLNTQCL